MKYLLISIINLVGFCALAQQVSLNTELLSHTTLNQDGNDIWGYEKDGIKYAVMGSIGRTNIFSLEDPTNPTLRYTANGTNSLWRDIKSYGDYLYVTADQGADGLVIIDMSKAPNEITHSFFKPELTVGTTTKVLDRCHNLYIDEKGFCYLAGCNISQKGILMFDLKIDPKNPVFVGAEDVAYSHDAFVQGDTLYTSEIYQGKMGLYDISDKANPKVLARQNTSRNFTHNVWVSNDSKYAFTTDEKADAYVDAYDISDLNNIKLLDKFRPLERENTGVIPHNTHYFNGYLVTSWYTDGIRIVDAHKPDNLIEVGFYDTWENPEICHVSYNGCWGVFPFTDNGWIYGSDIQNGLYIVKVDYKRACYLEGAITDLNGLAIPNANITILSDQINKGVSSPNGTYKTGQVLTGTFQVSISHTDFYTEIATVDLVAGEVTSLDVKLTPKVDAQVSIVVSDSNMVPVSSKVILRDDTKSIPKTIDGDGKDILTVLSSNYELYITSWGKENVYLPEFEVLPNANKNYTVEVKSAYQDDFETDLGWTINSSAGMTGPWQRAIPRQTEYYGGEIANPGVDSNDFGKYAFVTGDGIRGAECADVDNGSTELISPEMDLTTYQRPSLNYDVWFYNDGRNPNPNDTLIISLTNGTDEVIVDKVYGKTNGWLERRDIDIKDFIAPTQNMQLVVTASDQSGVNAHVVEAGFDHFFVSELPPSKTNESVDNNLLIIAPNPVGQYMTITIPDQLIGNGNSFQIYDVLGRIVQSGKIPLQTIRLDVSVLQNGMYYIQIKGAKTTPFIKI